MTTLNKFKIKHYHKYFCTHKTIQYISDIHLEKRTNFPRISPKSKNLALLGDIGHPHKPLYNDFINYISNNWENTFIIAGNHEYHSRIYDFNQINDKIYNITSKYNNVNFLNNQSINFDNHTILGTTLWSDIKYMRYNYDNKLIKLHSDSSLWLKNTLKNVDKNAIVLSHYLPSYKLIVNQYAKFSIYKKDHDRFASNLDDIISNPVKIWLCGHSHVTYEIYINNVFVGINSMGHGPSWKNRLIKYD